MTRSRSATVRRLDVAGLASLKRAAADPAVLARYAAKGRGRAGSLVASGRLYAAAGVMHAIPERLGIPRSRWVALRREDSGQIRSAYAAVGDALVASRFVADAATRPDASLDDVRRTLAEGIHPTSRDVQTRGSRSAPRRPSAVTAAARARTATTGSHACKLLLRRTE